MTKDVLKYLQPNAVIPIDMETTTALVNALKERLAQPEQEPTAKYSDIVSDGGLDPRNKFDVSPQRTWVGLTLEQYVAINSSCTTVDQAVGSTERQLKENNT